MRCIRRGTHVAVAVVVGVRALVVLALLLVLVVGVVGFVVVGEVVVIGVMIGVVVVGEVVVIGVVIGVVVVVVVVGVIVVVLVRVIMVITRREQAKMAWLVRHCYPLPLQQRSCCTTRLVSYDSHSLAFDRMPSWLTTASHL